MNILLTGINGTLGGFLYDNLIQKPNINVIANSRSVCDLGNSQKVNELYNDLSLDNIVHCAAYTDVKNSSKELSKVFNDNILSSINLIQLAMKKNSRFIFISTDFVFDGKSGFYKTDDPINPQTVYAKSKASIELALSCYSNSLIIRTSFFGKTFPFESACTDRYTSKDYIDIIGPMIIDQILGHTTGIIQLGTGRKSFYELASRRKYVHGCQCMQDGYTFGKDHSFYE